MEPEDDSEIRPLPDPPRRRGVPIGGGNYTGCSFGYGDISPYDTPTASTRICGIGRYPQNTRTVERCRCAPMRCNPVVADGKL
jgi:hypothetical protein